MNKSTKVKVTLVEDDTPQVDTPAPTHDDELDEAGLSKSFNYEASLMVYHMSANWAPAASVVLSTENLLCLKLVIDALLDEADATGSIDSEDYSIGFYPAVDVTDSKTAEGVTIPEGFFFADTKKPTVLTQLFDSAPIGDEGEDLPDEDEDEDDEGAAASETND